MNSLIIKLRSFLLIISSTFAITAFSQDLHIGYDAGGNRIFVYTNTELKSLDNTGQTKLDKGIKKINTKIAAEANELEVSLDNSLQSLSAEVFGTGAYSDGIFSVAPNPTKDLVVIAPKNKQEETFIYTLALYDGMGKLIEQFPVSTIPFTIDLSIYNPGMYFLRVSVKEISQTLKIIKI